ncbi:polysaccharide deacetylase family protein [Haladaptatus halobius]|uniref:polysaccharide deacetylase family protein n=1 Tax=Haladaptatus halobius TaxID=2884875 RepID=UPI001D09AC1E|nr:polysaccharide deacetylase [Haladaptatus halobius]
MSTVQSEQWGEYRAAAIFSFDLDADELWRTKIEADPEYDKPPIQTRGTFGPNVAVPRILEVFDRYDLTCTFFVPGKVVEKYPETIQAIHEAGHELGHHGYTHSNPATMSKEEEEQELVNALNAFDDVIGQTPVGYRSPAADLSNNSLELLAKHGFSYESSLIDNDVPYFHDLDNGQQLVEIPFEWSLDDWPYFGFNMYPPLPYQSGITPTLPVFESWQREFEGLHKRGRCFMLTMHPQIIGRAGRIDMLEELIQHILTTGDTWITSGAEIADHWHTTQS